MPNTSVPRVGWTHLAVALLAGSLAAHTAWAAKGGGKKKEEKKSDGAAPTGEAALKKLQELELSRASAAEVMTYMKSPDPRVRARTALALGRLQDWTVAEELVPSLSDPDSEVRKA